MKPLQLHEQKLLDRILRNAYDGASSWEEGEIKDLIDKIGSAELSEEVEEDSKHVIFRFD